MKWNEQVQQEAQKLVEALTPAQWKTVCETIPVLMQPISPEARKAEQERRERMQAKLEAKKADFEVKKEAFKRWREKKLKGFKIPAVYDFGVGEISPLTDYTLHEVAGHEGYFDTLTFMYDWGFKRGIAFQKRHG